MKKNYIIPQTEVTMINKVAMICTSTEEKSIYDITVDGGEALTKERTTVDFSQDNDFSF